MIKKSKRIQPVVDLAKHDERDAAKVLGGALAALNAAIEQLEQLKRYQSEYAERFNGAGQAGISSTRINDFRAFLAKVNDAVTAQQGVVERCRNELMQKKKFWFAKRGRSRALDTVLEKYEKDELYQLSRREQREQDEHAQRIKNEL